MDSKTAGSTVLPAVDIVRKRLQKLEFHQKSRGIHDGDTQ